MANNMTPINKIAKPIRKPLRAPSQKIRIERKDGYYLFRIYPRTLRITKYNAIRLAQWIIENG